MLRHQNVADNLEFQLGPQPGESGDDLPAEDVGIEQPRAAVRAGGNKMQEIEAAKVPPARPGGILTQGWHDFEPI